MLLRSGRWGLILMLAGAGLALAPSRVQAQGIDLDELSIDQLYAALDAELDDIFSQFDPDGEYDIKDLYPAIMYALGDAGDEGDAAEEVITLEALREEMAEQETTLEDEVWAALQEADELALSSDPPSLRFANIGFGADVPDGPKNGKTKTSTADTTVRDRLGYVVKR